jgi:hypothetical protein
MPNERNWRRFSEESGICGHTQFTFHERILEDFPKNLDVGDICMQMRAVERRLLPRLILCGCYMHSIAFKREEFEERKFPLESRG